MPSKTLMASAEKPADPVTFTFMPSRSPLTFARTSSTGPVIVSPSPLTAMSALRRAAWPFFEKTGGANGPVRGRSSELSSRRSARIWALLAAVSPSGLR